MTTTIAEILTKRPHFATLWASGLFGRLLSPNLVSQRSAHSAGGEPGGTHRALGPSPDHKGRAGQIRSASVPHGLTPRSKPLPWEAMPLSIGLAGSESGPHLAARPGGPGCANVKHPRFLGCHEFKIDHTSRPRIRHSHRWYRFSKLRRCTPLHLCVLYDFAGVVPHQDHHGAIVVVLVAVVRRGENLGCARVSSKCTLPGMPARSPERGSFARKRPLNARSLKAKSLFVFHLFLGDGVDEERDRHRDIGTPASAEGENNHRRPSNGTLHRS